MFVLILIRSRIHTEGHRLWHPVEPYPSTIMRASLAVAAVSNRHMRRGSLWGRQKLEVPACSGVWGFPRTYSTFPNIPH